MSVMNPQESGSIGTRLSFAGQDVSTVAAQARLRSDMVAVVGGMSTRRTGVEYLG